MSVKEGEMVTELQDLIDLIAEQGLTVVRVSENMRTLNHEVMFQNPVNGKFVTFETKVGVLKRDKNK